MIGKILEDSKGAIWLARAKIRDGKGPLCEVTGNQFSCTGAGRDSFRMRRSCYRRLGKFRVSGQDGICRWKSGSSQTYSSMALQRLEGVLEIGAMALAADGSLWVGIGARAKGLACSSSRMEFGETTPFPGFDRTNMPINALFVDRDNSLWIGTPNLGIFRLNEGKSDHFTAPDGLSRDTVNTSIRTGRAIFGWPPLRPSIAFTMPPWSLFRLREGLTTDEAEAVLGTRDGAIWIDNVGALDFLQNEKCPGLSGVAFPSN